MIPMNFEGHEIRSNHQILEVILSQLPNSMFCNSRGYSQTRAALAHAHGQKIHIMRTPTDADKFLGWLKGDAKVSDRQLFVYLRWIWKALEDDLRSDPRLFKPHERANIQSMREFLQLQLEWFEELPVKKPVINPPDDGPSYWYH